MGSHIAGLYFYDHPGTNNFILGFAILVMGDLIGSGGGYGDDAEGGGGGNDDDTTLSTSFAAFFAPAR